MPYKNDAMRQKHVPLRELAVHLVLVAGHDIALLELLHRSFRRLSAVVGGHLDVPLPEAVALAAGGRAQRPRAPLAPLRIHAVLVAGLLVAGRHLGLRLGLAELAAAPGRDRDAAVPDLLPAAAAAGAVAPRAPVAPLAVPRRLALLLVAPADLQRRVLWNLWIEKFLTQILMYLTGSTARHR